LAVAEFLEAFGHADEADTQLQPKKLESKLFSGPGI